MSAQQEIRAAYCQALMEIAEKDDRIVQLHADLMGGHGMKPFAQKYPERTFNVGVAEANMVGVAAGLATAGKIPFVHSFSTFASRRCFDQIAISVCYAKLKVVIVGSDPGVAAELNGGTHMGLEDSGIMRTLPGMRIIEPTDAVQIKAMMPDIVACPEPVYLRMSRKIAPSVFEEGYVHKPGKADKLRDGKDVTIFAIGVCVKEALEAAESLAAEGISARVCNMHTIKPLDVEAVVAAARETGAIVTAENHNVIGALGSAVAEAVVENCPVPVERIGIQDHFGQVGKMRFLMEEFGITAQHVAAAAKKAISRKN